MDTPDTLDERATAAEPGLTKRPKPYRAPRLTAYGSVAKLTQGGNYSSTDGVNTMMINPPGQG